MASRFFLALMVIGLGVFTPVFASAQEEAGEPESVQTAREQVQALIEPLNDAQRVHFYAIYDSHNLINVVRSVQSSVATGVEKCEENNPDMKDALQTRHKDWKDSINEVLKEADGNVSNMIAVQGYLKPKEIKKVLRFVDVARAEKDSEVEKIPVTSPEACEYLLNKMDETEDNLTQLLRSTLVSLPQALQNAQKAEEDAANAPAEAEDKAE